MLMKRLAVSLKSVCVAPCQVSVDVFRFGFG